VTPKAGTHDIVALRRLSAVYARCARQWLNSARGSLVSPALWHVITARPATTRGTLPGTMRTQMAAQVVWAEEVRVSP
jgi:hypothetical protein